MKRILIPVLFMTFFPGIIALADPATILPSRNTAEPPPAAQELRLTPPSSLTVKTSPEKNAEKLVFEISEEKPALPGNQRNPLAAPDIYREKLEKLILDGKEMKAASHIRTLSDQAETPEQKALVTATYANLLGRVSQIKKETPDLQIRAAELYKEALPFLKGDIRLLTTNNYGALLLRQKNPKEALRVLKSVEKEYSKTPDPVKKSTYYYNLGRAYETSGDPIRARASYQSSALADPAFSPASRAVNRLLTRIEASTTFFRETAEWLTAMVERGDLPLSEKTLLSVLSQKAWYTRDGFEILLIPFICYLTEVKIGPERFSMDWADKLPPEDLAAKKTTAVVREIISAYTKNHEINFRPGSSSPSFIATLGAAKHAGQVKRVTRFVKMIGDQYKAMGMPQKALQRFAAAWTMDTSNMEAAYAIAYTLLDSSADLPGMDNLLDSFTFQLFELKGAAYRAPLGQDWENILRFHLVLGTIYSRKGIWGNRYDARSAIFQLEHAVKSHSRLTNQKKGKDAGPIAGVQVELGNAYKETGDYGQAGSIYVTAAQSAIRENDPIFASQIVSGLRENSGRYRLSDLDKARLDQVEATLALPVPAIRLRIE